MRHNYSIAMRIIVSIIPTHVLRVICLLSVYRLLVREYKNATCDMSTAELATLTINSKMSCTEAHSICDFGKWILGQGEHIKLCKILQSRNITDSLISHILLGFVPPVLRYDNNVKMCNDFNLVIHCVRHNYA